MLQMGLYPLPSYTVSLRVVTDRLAARQDSLNMLPRQKPVDLLTTTIITTKKLSAINIIQRGP